MNDSILATGNIQHYIDNQLQIRDKEKNKYGEVLTPSVLIDEILDQFPTSVWKNKDLTWLDPAAGTGNYFLVVYSRYMKSLESIFPNKKERSNHILHNMLHMMELNPANSKILRDRFGKNANVVQGDFLDESANLQDYDIILGNPPFQTEKSESYQGSSGNRTLWNKFIKRSLDILKPQGYLGFITPSNWRRPESELYTKMTRENQLLFLHIYGKKKGKELFGVESRFDNYLIQKSRPFRKTKIIDETGNEFHEDISKWPFLPNSDYSSINHMLRKNDESGIPVIFDSSFYDARKLKKNASVKYKYPVIHTIGKKGLGIRYAGVSNPDQIGVPKVLLNFNENQYPYNDFQGKYGMSQLTFGIPISSKSEGDAWIKFINSDRFRSIIKATKWNAFQTDYRMFPYLDKNIVKLRTLKRYDRSIHKRKTERRTR